MGRQLDSSQRAWEGEEDTLAGDPEERRVLFAALDSFYQYPKVAHYNTTHLRRQSFYALPRAHLELLTSPPFSYLDTLNSVDDAIDKNAELASAILEAGLQSFSLPFLPTPVNKGEKSPNDWHGLASPNDLEKARSTLRQFYRDWSSEGRAEREACYGPVTRALTDERDRQERRLNVLVPGAGLGRLVFELCCEGFNVEGNEISYHQLLASSYILNFCPDNSVHTLHPWVHSFSNHRSRESHLMSVQIPDVHPGSTLAQVKSWGQMSMSASDFILLYGAVDQKAQFDAVATVFFLDTAPNIIRYIEVIYNCLKPDGLLVNMGPLLWHFENNAPGTHGHSKEGMSETGDDGIAEPGSVELTDDEVVALVEKLGFIVEKRESGIAAPYIQDPGSMLQNIYRASFWVARKR